MFRKSMLLNGILLHPKLRVNHMQWGPSLRVNWVTHDFHPFERHVLHREVQEDTKQLDELANLKNLLLSRNPGCNGFNLGNHNTKFFFKSVHNRMGRNRIVSISRMMEPR